MNIERAIAIGLLGLLGSGTILFLVIAVGAAVAIHDGTFIQPSCRPAAERGAP